MKATITKDLFTTSTFVAAIGAAFIVASIAFPNNTFQATQKAAIKAILARFSEAHVTSIGAPRTSRHTRTYFAPLFVLPSTTLASIE